MAKLNKNQIIEIVAEKGHLSKRDAKVAVDLTFSAIEKSIKNGEDVSISNFGTFEALTKQSREGTNPKTHEIIVIPETKTISFKPCKTLKEKLNK